MAATIARTLKLGMVGGGPGAFIGDVHRRAALLAGGVEFVAGAFSSSPRRSRAKGRELLLDPSRVYDSVEHLIAEERRLPEGERVDLVAVVTPNHLHFRSRRRCWRRASTWRATSR